MTAAQLSQEEPAVTLPASVSASERRRIENWDDERDMGNSLLVTLKPGWRFSTDPLVPTHVEGFDTVTEARRGVRQAVTCECAECTKSVV